MKISRTTVTIAAGFLFLAYSFLPIFAPPRFNSPDEMSNHFFSDEFRKTSRLWFLEPLNLITQGLVHPRSMRVVDNFTVPGGFIGLPVIYGAVAKVSGMAAVPFLTPLLAVLAVLAWSGLVSRFFGKPIGLAAAVVLAAHPIWWYESARTMFPNIPFLSLLVIAAYFLFAAPVEAYVRSRGLQGIGVMKHLDGVLAGIFAGLALAVRPAEAYWLAIAAAILAPYFYQRLGRRVLLAAAFFSVTLAPFLVMNQVLYGSPFGTGYGSLDAIDAGLTNTGGRAAALLGPARPYLFPLGFAPRTALANFWRFGLAFLPWWTLAVAAAAVMLVAEARSPQGLARRRAWKLFALVAAGVGLWLIPFYGSWVLSDNSDPAATTIGYSYFRYWLPIFVFSTVPVAWAAVRLLERLRAKGSLIVFAALGYVALSAWVVFGSEQEGLLAVRRHLISYDQVAAEIVARTEPKSVIVVDSADKFLFPERVVLQPLRSEATYAALPSLATQVKLYYYGITLPEKDLQWLTATKLAPGGMNIEAVATFGEETLYRLGPAASAIPQTR